MSAATIIGPILDVVFPVGMGQMVGRISNAISNELSSVIKDAQQLANIAAQVRTLGNRLSFEGFTVTNDFLEKARNPT